MTDCPRVENVELLWAADYWDGPMAGLARHDGSDYWYEAEAFDWDTPPSERRYLLYPMTDEELAAEHEAQRAFRKHVGTHTSYRDNRVVGRGKVRPESEWQKFYEKYEYRSYADRPPIGWFSL